MYSGGHSRAGGVLFYWKRAIRNLPTDIGQREQSRLIIERRYGQDSPSTWNTKNRTCLGRYSVFEKSGVRLFAS
jgi:hypothetical protein